ncbi:hypothetical protein MNV49_002169 [Pseudohyphozyma bogoriensis]|nr:hypothetical protein MNV49_002169 [Pseudohyphozyma bogoriensis]
MSDPAPAPAPFAYLPDTPVRRQRRQRKPTSMVDEYRELANEVAQVSAVTTTDAHGVERLLVGCEAARRIEVGDREMEGLLVRQDYHALVKTLFDLMDKYDTNKHVTRHLSIYGQPGIGKSVSLFYLLALLLSIKHNVAIFPTCFRSKFIAIEFDEDDVHTVTEQEDVAFPDKIFVCLIDDVEPLLTSLQATRSFTVMACYPDRPSADRFGKHRNEASEDPADYLPTELFHLVGPTARACFVPTTRDEEQLLNKYVDLAKSAFWSNARGLLFDLVHLEARPERKSLGHQAGTFDCRRLLPTSLIRRAVLICSFGLSDHNTFVFANYFNTRSQSHAFAFETRALTLVGSPGASTATIPFAPSPFHIDLPLLSRVIFRDVDTASLKPDALDPAHEFNPHGISAIVRKYREQSPTEWESWKWALIWVVDQEATGRALCGKLGSGNGTWRIGMDMRQDRVLDVGYVVVTDRELELREDW